jgi:dihydrofolate reductase
MSVTLVLAMADNGVIGKDGAIPWHISDDLKRFKALTLGKPVVMGRKTWDSLPRKPLPGRHNIVVTRNPGWRALGAIPATLPDIDLSYIAPNKDVTVIGGAEIYRYFLPRADRIELTEVHADFDGDAVFDFDRSDWREMARENHVTPDGLAYSYVTLTRR